MVNGTGCSNRSLEFGFRRPRADSLRGWRIRCYREVRHPANNWINTMARAIDAHLVLSISERKNQFVVQEMALRYGHVRIGNLIDMEVDIAGLLLEPNDRIGLRRSRSQRSV